VICDTGGSICEVVDPEDPADPVLSTLAASTLMLWIEDTEAHRAELIRRFDLAPKPMYYHPDFLVPLWQEYLTTNAVAPEAVDPDAFVRFAYARALDHRAPLYAAMARNWGVSVTAAEVEAVRDAQDAIALVAAALGRHGPTA